MVIRNKFSASRKQKSHVAAMLHGFAVYKTGIK